MKLEEEFRFKLQGQLSDEKTELDVTIASKIAREFTISFCEWYIKIAFILDTKYIGKSTKELLKIYEDEGNITP